MASFGMAWFLLDWRGSERSGKGWDGCGSALFEDAGARHVAKSAHHGGGGAKAQVLAGLDWLGRLGERTGDLAGDPHRHELRVRRTVDAIRTLRTPRTCTFQSRSRSVALALAW